MRRRTHDRGEAIHARLEAQLRANLDDPRATRAYAESLRERGDPLGEAMLLALRAEECARQRGYSWVMNLEESWSMRDSRAGRRLERLIFRHWHHWFGELAVTDVIFNWRHGLIRDASIMPWAMLPSLKHLLDRPPMRFVQRLEARDYRGPLGNFKVFPKLKELIIPVITALDSARLLDGLGEALMLSGSAGELRRWRPTLRRTFPGVRLCPRLPEAEIDTEFIGPTSNREPQWAGRAPTQCTQTTEDAREFRHCAACAGEDTTLLATVVDQTPHYRRVTYEYVCHECGYFSWYGVIDKTVSLRPRKQPRRSRSKIRLAS